MISHHSDRSEWCSSHQRGERVRHTGGVHVRFRHVVAAQQDEIDRLAIEQRHPTGNVLCGGKWTHVGIGDKRDAHSMERLCSVRKRKLDALQDWVIGMDMTQTPIGQGNGDESYAADGGQ